jgi:hypothetical protein
MMKAINKRKRTKISKPKQPTQAKPNNRTGRHLKTNYANNNAKNKKAKNKA